MEVPENGTVLAINFKGVERLVAASIARGLKRSEGAVAEARQKGGGIVDEDLLFFASERVLALFDKGLCHGGDGIDSAVEPQGGINTVRKQITGDAAAGDRGFQAPGAGSALGNVGIDRLQITAPQVARLR